MHIVLIYDTAASFDHLVYEINFLLCKFFV